MINATHNVRVIKHTGGSYDTYANFTTVQNALHHMRRLNFANDSWYIIDANDNRLRLNDQDKLEVFHSLIG
jgi:glucose-6-phosphate isomerase